MVWRENSGHFGGEAVTEDDPRGALGAAGVPALALGAGYRAVFTWRKC